MPIRAEPSYVTQRGGNRSAPAAFSFDGGGIDVHVLGGTGGAFAGGVDLSINMVGTAFDGGSAVLGLPAGVTLDDFDGLSVWCVPVGFSFGDGQFE